MRVKAIARLVIVFHPDMKFYVLSFIMLMTFLDFAASQYKCDFRMYGRPKVEDCASAFLTLPDAREIRLTLRLSTFRKFVEPQLLEPPFSPVDNDLASEMEQLPKFWKFSEPSSQ